MKRDQYCIDCSRKVTTIHIVMNPSHNVSAPFNQKTTRYKLFDKDKMRKILNRWKPLIRGRGLNNMQWDDFFKEVLK